MPVIPAIKKWRQGDREFKVILGCIASLRGAWATQDLVSLCVSVPVCLCVSVCIEREGGREREEIG